MIRIKSYEPDYMDVRVCELRTEVDTTYFFTRAILTRRDGEYFNGDVRKLWRMKLKIARQRLRDEIRGNQ